jgi:hypothetical protein
LRLKAQKKSATVSQASSFQPIACEHLQKPHNAGSRREARFLKIPCNKLQGIFDRKECARFRGSTPLLKG